MILGQSHLSTHIIYLQHTHMFLSNKLIVYASTLTCIFMGDLATQISNYVSLHHMGPYIIVVQFSRTRRHNGNR